MPDCRIDYEAIADIVDGAVSAALEEHVDGAEIRIKNELAELNTTVRKLQHELHTLMQLVAANIKGDPISVDFDGFKYVVNISAKTNSCEDDN